MKKQLEELNLRIKQLTAVEVLWGLSESSTRISEGFRLYDTQMSELDDERQVEEALRDKYQQELVMATEELEKLNGHCDEKEDEMGDEDKSDDEESYTLTMSIEKDE